MNQFDATTRNLPLRAITDNASPVSSLKINTKEIAYIDVSALDRTTKTVSSVSLLKQNELPSRVKWKIQRNDILVSTVRPELNAVALANEKLEGAFASSAFCVLRPKLELVLPKFVFFFSTSQLFVESLVRRQRGVGFPAVSDSDVKSLEIPLPPILEQERIVAILKQAELVRQKHAILESASLGFLEKVFKQFFGEIHPRKNAVLLSELASVSTGGTPSRANERFFGTQHPWITSAELLNEYIDDSQEKLSNEGLRAIAGGLYPEGTILLAMYGQGNTRGRSGMLRIKASVNQACAAIIPKNSEMGNFIWAWIQLSVVV